LNELNKKPAGLPHWIIVFGRTTGAAVVTTLFTLVANVLILRILPVVDAGRYALLISLAPMLALLGGFGQAALLKRRYSLRPPGAFNWSRDLAGSLLFSAPGLLLSVLAAMLVYRLSPGSIVFLSLAAPLLVLSQATAGVLDSHRLYVWAGVLIRLPNSLMVIPAGAVLLLPGLADLWFFLAAQIAVIGVSVALGLLLLVRRVPRGPAVISPRERAEGLSLGIMSGTNPLLSQGVIAVAGAIVPPGSLAALAAIATLVRPVHLIHNLALGILTVELARDRKLRRARVGWMLGVGAVLLVLILSACMPLLTRVAYGGRYQGFVGLGLPLVLIGGLLLTEILPRAYVKGSAATSQLKRFALWQVGIALCGVVMILASSKSAGVVGATWAGVAIAVLRNLVAYLFYWSLTRSAPPPSATGT